MRNGNPTPEELDRLSNQMLGKSKCGTCRTTFNKFTDLVEHKKNTGH
jgi:hypothetical protein